MYISGLKSGGMLHFNGEAVYMAATLPAGTHNAQPWRDGVLFNDTNADALRYSSRSGEEDRAIKVPTYDPADIDTKMVGDSGVARQGFARGLCLVNDRVVAGGSSPSTVSLYACRNRRRFSRSICPLIFAMQSTDWKSGRSSFVTLSKQ